MPKILSDALKLLGPPALVWAAQDLVPQLATTNPQAATLVAGAVGMLTLIFTPLEKTYGVGVPDTAPRGVDPGA